MARKRIAPVHPGDFLAELAEELGISQARLARDLHVSPMRISHVIRGKRPITAELALRLGQYFGQSPRYWLNLQSRFDMDVAEENFGSAAQKVRPFKAVA